ncbi:MAG: Fic family protein, partial [Actinomycetota bacterium]|nr:Fic family protein [Actinomycetota bacterium]
MPPPRSDAAALTARLALLTALPGVAEGAEAAREACTRLRFDEALRRRIPEAAAESRIRGAQASAALEGADVPLDRVRDHVRGALAWPDPPDPVDSVLRGVVQATAETEHVTALVLRAPLQALARLHVAAMAGLLPSDQVGRPRQEGETSQELVDLGPAPSPAEVAARLAEVAAMLTAAVDAPAVVVAGVVHAEIATIRPFVRGNGAVARAMERCIIQA